MLKLFLGESFEVKLTSGATMRLKPIPDEMLSEFATFAQGGSFQADSFSKMRDAARRLVVGFKDIESENGPVESTPENVALVVSRLPFSVLGEIARAAMEQAIGGDLIAKNAEGSATLPSLSPSTSEISTGEAGTADIVQS